MENLIAIISPKGLSDWIFKVTLFAVIIILANAGVVWVLTGRHADLIYDTVVTAFTATPFVVFALWLISYLYKLQQRLAELAATDVLTGLANRRAFLAAAGEIRTGVLLLLDVDYFKRVNDTYGHAVGDLCLKAVARRLTASIRKGDIVARYGGEEFAIGLVGADLDVARLVGARLAEGVRINACKLGESEATETIVTVSIGAAVVQPGIELHELLRRADAALYRAKAGGRARLSVFDRDASPFVAPSGRVVG